jgi:adenylate kinase
VNAPPQEDVDVEVDREHLEEIREAIKNNNGVVPTDTLTKCLRDKLLSKPCRNQGFVLDGFPTKLEEATALYAGIFPFVFCPLM